METAMTMRTVWTLDKTEEEIEQERRMEEEKTQVKCQSSLPPLTKKQDRRLETLIRRMDKLTEQRSELEMNGDRDDPKFWKKYDRIQAQIDENIWETEHIRELY